MECTLWVPARLPLVSLTSRFKSKRYGQKAKSTRLFLFRSQLWIFIVRQVRFLHPMFISKGFFDILKNPLIEECQIIADFSFQCQFSRSRINFIFLKLVFYTIMSMITTNSPDLGGSTLFGQCWIHLQLLNLWVWSYAKNKNLLPR